MACGERARHLDRPAVLRMIDLDRFKQATDRGAHAAKDAMMRAVAKALHSEVRGSDTVARLGGDECALILDGCKSEQTQAVSLKILRATQGSASTARRRDLTSARKSANACSASRRHGSSLSGMCPLFLSYSNNPRCRPRVSHA
jgi:diguanylate cyclase (GGDEF)-like protein